MRQRIITHVSSLILAVVLTVRLNWIVTEKIWLQFYSTLCVAFGVTAKITYNLTTCAKCCKMLLSTYEQIVAVQTLQLELKCLTNKMAS